MNLKAQIIARSETRGKKYAIEVWRLSPVDFKVEEFTRGHSSGSSCGHKTQEDAILFYKKKIEDARHYDGINYKAVGVE